MILPSCLIDDEPVFDECLIDSSFLEPKEDDDPFDGTDGEDPFAD